MKFIKQSSIDTVLQEASIYTVISDTEDLKKKGANWFCLSPFSGETGTASFCVSESKNNFFDYSSGFGGNAVSFLMKRHNLGFFEAISKAAELCNIVLDHEEQSEDAKRMQDEMQSMKRIVSQADLLYQQAYSKLPDTHWAKQMIADRGFSKETVANFFIGFAPNERSYVSTPLLNQGDYTQAVEIGITKTKDGASYDFFRNRLIFPIHDVNGIVHGFGGRRSNEESDKEYAKYLNSPESKLYHKERIIYGLYQAKKAIQKQGKAILLEGYTDVIALHEKGVETAVASCGTALTEQHAKLLSRFTKHVIIFRDGDKAGQKAAMRDIDILIKESIKVSIVVCPSGEDPDSLSKKTDIDHFIEKNIEDAILWKAKILHAEASDPGLPELIKSMEAQHEEEVKILRAEISPEEAFKGLDAFAKKDLKNQNTEIQKSISLKERELKERIKELPKYEPHLLSDSIQSIAMTLHRIPNKIVQKGYLGMVAKAMDQKANLFQDIITEIEKKEESERKRKTIVNSDLENEQLRLPKGADKVQFLEDRFCEIGNSYHFEGESGFLKGTNHKLTPLFHVEGKIDNKRLCEVVNEDGHKRLIDFDSKDLINFNRFQERLIDEGNFYWDGGATNRHFKLVMKKMLNSFITASELKTLGQQKEDFFAFADGIYHDNTFSPVNKYGIVHLDQLEKEKSEYRSDIKHYYSPAFSEIYKHARDDDDPYENDRHFIYKIAPISLDQWAKQMVTVFGDKGKFGVAFCLAANFRDLFLTHYNYFPLMGGFGQKDSGKSGLGMAVQSFFFYDLQPLELNIATLVGMSRRLQRVKNAIGFFDEMREDLDEEKFQMMKGAWNGLGREKGKGADTNRTSTDRINSAIYYCGQYISTRDDGALPSRSISLMFQNKEYTAQEREEYQRLKNWCSQGISSFVLDVIKHRKKFKANLMREYSECAKDLKKELDGRDFQNRIFENYLAILTSVKLLKDYFSLPYSYDEFLKLTADYVIDNSELISDSDGLAKFWNIVEFLSKPMDVSQPNKTAIKEGIDYKIERASSFKILVSKTEKKDYKNIDRDQILFLNFSSVHQHYHKEATSRKGEEIIGMTTLRNYFKSKKYFIGLFPAMRMGNYTPSGYAFNYTMMRNMGIVDLEYTVENQVEMDDILKSSLKTIVTNPAQAIMNIPDSKTY
jgi:DNA primase